MGLTYTVWYEWEGRQNVISRRTSAEYGTQARCGGPDRLFDGLNYDGGLHRRDLRSFLEQVPQLRSVPVADSVQCAQRPEARVRQLWQTIRQVLLSTSEDLVGRSVPQFGARIEPGLRAGQYTQHGAQGCYSRAWNPSESARPAYST